MEWCSRGTAEDPPSGRFADAGLSRQHGQAKLILVDVVPAAGGWGTHSALGAAAERRLHVEAVNIVLLTHLISDHAGCLTTQERHARLSNCPMCTR